MIKKLFKLSLKGLKWLGLTLTVIVVGSVVFTLVAPTFGGSPDATSLAKFAKSQNHNGEKFINLMPIKVSMLGNSGKDNGTNKAKDNESFLKVVMGFISPPKEKNPNQPLPTKPIVANAIAEGSFTWLGHSTVLFKTAGKTIITDPVFHAAAPVSFAVKPFDMQDAPQISDLPPIDAVLISHDHYDHLDYRAVKKLKDKVAHFYVPLGIKAHLQRWGVADDKITEMDWYESTQVGDVTLILTPSRHFSGRGLFDRSKTLWSSWVVKSPELAVYFSGDGGYSPEFKKIGEKFGPFDMAFMEDGAYNEKWAQVHMMPEQSAQAAVDIRAKVLLPIHWAKFDLSTHVWKEPVQRIAKAVDEQNKTLTKAGNTPMTLATPMIGETFTLDNLPTSEWWVGVK